jgi:hypothetical protein
MGDNYEQLTPVRNVQHPQVDVVANTLLVQEGGTMILSANAIIDEQNGAVADFYWCAEQGTFEYNPDFPDYSVVKYIAPQVTDDSAIRVAVQVGDNLGHADVDSLMIQVLESSNDSDGDGLSDTWEEHYFDDVLFQDADGDYDNDGIPNIWEAEHGLDPLENDAGADPDGNGFTNLQEYLYGIDT